MVEISTLYTHLKTLNKQWFYEKSESDEKYIAKSQTSGLVKNDGTIDTNIYLTEHQSLANYVEKSQTSGLIKNDGTIDTTTYQEAGDYIETSQTSGLVKNDGTIDTTTYLTAQDISGKANSADLHAVATSGSYNDLENKPSLATVATSGNYTDLNNIPETFAPGEHTHSIDDITDFSASASDVTDSSAYSNLGTSANATQHAINTAIDTKIGSLLSVELIEVASTRPTASASTMNKLYLVPETTGATDDAYEVFVTVEDDGAYSWEKIDTARIDLSGYASIDHVHGNITNDGKIGSNANYFVYTSTGGAVSSKQKIGNIDTSGAIGNESGKVVVTTNSGVLTTSDWVTEVDNVIQSLTTYGSSLNNS